MLQFWDQRADDYTTARVLMFLMFFSPFPSLLRREFYIDKNTGLPLKMAAPFQVPPPECIVQLILCPDITMLSISSWEAANDRKCPGWEVHNM